MIAAFFSIFAAVFLAELGDKTQLATVLFASDGGRSRWLVFAAASSALVASTVAAVLLGAAAERWMGVIPLKLLAGIGFILIGLWTVAEHYRG